MTGGSEEGFRANKNLAAAAKELSLPVGLGSIRVLFEHPEVFEHFYLRPLAGDVPILANLGGVQIATLNHEDIVAVIRRLEVNALVVHLNPGQELFQPDGDRDFSGIAPAIARLCDISPVPIIVKETGFGIAPEVTANLLDSGVAYVDLAGAGGTNWISVEAYRGDESLLYESEEFMDWGVPTALLLATIQRRYDHKYDGKVLASGGIRTGMDVAKSVALGALSAGMALPLIRAEVRGGKDAIITELERAIRTVERVMVLTGSRTVDDLRRAPLYFTGTLENEIQSLSRKQSYA